MCLNNLLQPSDILTLGEEIVKYCLKFLHRNVERRASDNLLSLSCIRGLFLYALSFKIT
jgi:hypothetical protein